MKIIAGGQGSGKTTAAIQIASENDSYIVCPDQRRCQAVADLAQKQGIKIRYPITLEELKRKEFYGKGVKSFVLDDVLDMIKRLASPVEIEAITFNWDGPQMITTDGGR